MANELKQLIDKINKEISNEKHLRVAISTALSVHKPRIFESGQDAKGSKIGTYGTNPISISKKQQAKSTGKTYFKGGYSEYKSAIGKNPGYVNLVNTGQMQSDYGIIRTSSGFGLGFQNRLNYDKSQWMQEKYDKDIFDHTQEELDIIANVLSAQINASI